MGSYFHLHGAHLCHGRVDEDETYPAGEGDPDDTSSPSITQAEDSNSECHFPRGHEQHREANHGWQLEVPLFRRCISLLQVQKSRRVEQWGNIP